MDHTLTAGSVTVRSPLGKVLGVIGNTPDGVYAVDETHRIILWNDGAHRILGYSAEEALGKSCFEVVAGRDAEGRLVCQRGCGDMALARAGMLVPSRDLLTRTKNGDDVWLNLTNIPVPSDLGGLSTVVHIFLGVTARKHMEQLVERLTSLMERFAAFQAERPTYSQDTPADHDPLTPREREVLALLAEGANAASIAKARVISSTTARKHVQNLLGKLHVHTALEALLTLPGTTC